MMVSLLGVEKIIVQRASGLRLLGRVIRRSETAMVRGAAISQVSKSRPGAPTLDEGFRSTLSPSEERSDEESRGDRKRRYRLCSLDSSLPWVAQNDTACGQIIHTSKHSCSCKRTEASQRTYDSLSRSISRNRTRSSWLSGASASRSGRLRSVFSSDLRRRQRRIRS